MAVQTEPFRAGPFAGRMPSDVHASMPDSSIPVYSKRQISLQEYIMMLSVTEKRFSTATLRTNVDRFALSLSLSLSRFLVRPAHKRVWVYDGSM